VVRNLKTVGLALIIVTFCVFGYRLYTERQIVNGIETVNVGGTVIAIRGLAGYCNELDRDFFSPLERSDRSRHVIAVSAPCADLAAFKDGRAAGLEKYIVWSVDSTDDGNPRRLPADITQSDFANEMTKAAQGPDPAEIVSEVARNGSKIGIIGRGLIDREVDAVYEVYALSGESGGTVKIVACVTGIAAIHHFDLWIAAYDKYSGNASFSELLTSVKPLMHAALSDNPEN